MSRLPPAAQYDPLSGAAGRSDPAGALDEAIAAASELTLSVVTDLYGVLNGGLDAMKQLMAPIQARLKRQIGRGLREVKENVIPSVETLYSAINGGTSEMKAQVAQTAAHIDAVMSARAAGLPCPSGPPQTFPPGCITPDNRQFLGMESVPGQPVPVPRFGPLSMGQLPALGDQPVVMGQAPPAFPPPSHPISRVTPPGPIHIPPPGPIIPPIPPVGIGPWRVIEAGCSTGGFFAIIDQPTWVAFQASYQAEWNKPGWLVDRVMFGGRGKQGGSGDFPTYQDALDQLTIEGGLPFLRSLAFVHQAIQTPCVTPGPVPTPVPGPGPIPIPGPGPPPPVPVPPPVAGPPPTCPTCGSCLGDRVTRPDRTVAIVPWGKFPDQGPGLDSQCGWKEITDLSGSLQPIDVLKAALLGSSPRRAVDALGVLPVGAEPDFDPPWEKAFAS